MHKGTLFWNVDCQNLFEMAFLCEYFLCKFFNCILMGTLRNTHCDGFLI